MNAPIRPEVLQQSAAQLDAALRTRCEVWTRVMGYHRPVSAFNIGKQGEFAERKFFKQ
ncbi:hypothetical protein JCM19000A_17160 [Silvimonas sp. JCM 19000]